MSLQLLGSGSNFDHICNVGSDASSRSSKLGSKIQSRKAESKSQASVTILDILKDGTGSPELPDPQKSANDMQSPLFNPFQSVATPGRVRVSTPTPRKVRLFMFYSLDMRWLTNDCSL